MSTAGTVTCAGTLTVASIANAALSKVYTIVSAGTVSGTFSGLVNGAKFTQQGRTFQIAYTGTTVTLTDVARPTTRVWDGGGADNNWTTAANWDFDLAPVAGDDLQFAGATRTAPNNDFPADTSFASITFNAGASAFTVGGNRITLAGNVTNSSSAAQTVSAALVLGGATTVTATSNPIALSGVLSGTGSLTSTGVGGLSLGSTNTFSGGVTVSQGTVNASGTGCGTGLVTVSAGATLAAGGASGLLARYYNVAPSFGNFTSLNGLLTHLLATQTTALENVATTMNFGSSGNAFPSPYNSGASNFEALYTGKISIATAGVYTFTTASDDGSVLFVDGAMVVNNNFFQSVSTRSGTVALATGLHSLAIGYYQGAGGYGLNAQISGADNTTMVDISTANVAITAGLDVYALAGAGTVAATNGNLWVGLGNTSTTFSGVITGGGDLTKDGTGTLTLSGANAYTGTTTVVSGTLTNGAAGVIPDGSALTVGSGASWNLNGFSETVGSLAGSGNVSLGSATLTCGGTNGSTTYAGVISGSGALVKGGTGTLTLTSTQTYTGSTTITGGSLRLSTLSHRWSFNNSLADSVGGSTATMVAVGANAATLSANVVTLSGGARASSDYVDLGSGLIPKDGTPWTIELWATTTALQSWGRIFDIGSSTANGLFMSWTTGTNQATDRVSWKNGTEYLTDNTIAPYMLGTRYHIALRIQQQTSTSSLLEWYAAPATDSVITAKSGSVIVPLTLANLADSSSALGRSQYPGDNTATASYDEVRFWNSALSISSLNSSQVAGPDSLAGGDTGHLPATTAVTLSGTGNLDLSGAAQTIGSLTGTGGTSVTLTGGGVTTGGDGTSTSFAGTLSGAGSLTKVGAGVQTLSGTNTFTGATAVAAGTLLVSGSTAAGSAVSVANGATLGGTGTVDGTVALAAGATLAPGLGGTAIGTLTTGSVTCNATSTLSLDLDGAMMTNDRVSSSGTVACAGTLTVASIAGAAVGQAYTIVSAGSVSGTFSGLANGSTFTQLGRTFQIVYGSASVTLIDCTGVGASTRTWNGGGADNNWTTAANWVGGQPPLPGDALVFAGATRPAPNNDFAASTSFAGITFNSGAAAFTVGGNAIGLTGGLTNSSANLQTVGLAMAVTGTSACNAASGDITISGVVSGTGGLSKSGSGTVILSSASCSYSGGTAISAGTLQTKNFTGSYSLSGGALTADFSNFLVTNPITLTGNAAFGVTTGNQINIVGGSVSAGTNTLTKTGPGILYLNLQAVTVGAITVAQGCLGSDQNNIASNHALGGSGVTIAIANGAQFLTFENTTVPNPFVLNGGNGVDGNGTLWNQGGGSSTFTGAITMNADSSIGTSGGNLTVSGVIAGTAALTKLGANTLTLSGANTWVGTTTVSAGTLKDGAAGVIPDGSALTVASGATWSLNNLDETIGSLAGAGSVSLGSGTLTLGGDNTSTTFTGTTSGSGLITKNGTGTYTITTNGTNTSKWTINAGLVAPTNSSNFGTAPGSYTADYITLNGGGIVFNTTINPNPTRGITLAAGGGSLAAAAGLVWTVSTVVTGPGNLTIGTGGAGTVALANVDTFAGSVAVAAGTLQNAIADPLPDACAVTVNGGAVYDLNGFSDTIGSLAGSGNVTLGSATLTCGGNNTSTTYSGVMSGSGALAKAGTGTLSLVTATNTYTGATTVAGGTLLVTGSTAAASAVTVASGATLGGTGTVAGTIAVAAGGTLAPGAGGTAIGTLTTGAVSCNATATLSADLDGSAASDRVATSGAFACAGTLTIASNANAAVGKVYTLVSAGSVSGTFSGLADQAVFSQAGRLFRIAYTATTVTVTDCAPVVTARQTGDANGNGHLDRIRLTFDLPLNDDTSGLIVTVAGYQVTGFSTGTANDAVMDVLVTELAAGDTGATPVVRITANTSLARVGGAGLVQVEGSGTAAADAAAPVLLSSAWSDGGSGGVSAGDTVTLTFSESVTAAVAGRGRPRPAGDERHAVVDHHRRPDRRDPDHDPGGQPAADAGRDLQRGGDGRGQAERPVPGVRQPPPRRRGPGRGDRQRGQRGRPGPQHHHGRDRLGDRRRPAVLDARHADRRHHRRLAHQRRRPDRARRRRLQRRPEHRQRRDGAVELGARSQRRREHLSDEGGDQCGGDVRWADHPHVLRPHARHHRSGTDQRTAEWCDVRLRALFPGTDQRHQRLSHPADHRHLGDRRVGALREFDRSCALNVGQHAIICMPTCMTAPQSCCHEPRPRCGSTRPPKRQSCSTPRPILETITWRSVA